MLRIAWRTLHRVRDTAVLKQHDLVLRSERLEA
jgi:hypothetical protein